MLATIESVVDRSVEVFVVFGDFGSEFDEVEVRIAPHQRIEGPGDGLQGTFVGPRPLVPFQGFANSTGVVFWQHPGDVRMQGGLCAEESPTGAGQFLADPRQ